MDFNRLTEKVQQALQAAQSTALRYSHQQIDVEHLVSALLDQEGGLATSLLNKANIQVEPLRRRVGQELDKIPKVTSAAGAPNQVYVTNRLTQLFMAAEDEAKRLK